MDCEFKVGVHVQRVCRQSGGAGWKSSKVHDLRSEYVNEQDFPQDIIATPDHLLSSVSIWRLIPRNALTAEFILDFSNT